MSVTGVLLRDQFKYNDGENTQTLLTDIHNLFSVSRKGTIYKWDRFGNCKKYIKRFKNDCITLFNNKFVLGLEGGIVEFWDLKGKLKKCIITTINSTVTAIT